MQITVDGIPITKHEVHFDTYKSFFRLGISDDIERLQILGIYYGPDIRVIRRDDKYILVHVPGFSFHSGGKTYEPASAYVFEIDPVSARIFPLYEALTGRQVKKVLSVLERLVWGA